MATQLREGFQVRYSCSNWFSLRATVPSLYLQYIGRNTVIQHLSAVRVLLGPRVTGRTASLRIPSGAFLQVLQPKAPNASLCMQFLTQIFDPDLISWV